MTDSEDQRTPSIRIDLVDPDTMELWRTVAKVAQALADQRTPWCLVGGLMVALFAIEGGQVQRPTTDIDILGDARGRPSGTEAVSERLAALGATLHDIGGLEAERAFRFEVHGQVVDVLAPDGLAKPALTRAPLQTIQIPRVALRPCNAPRRLRSSSGTNARGSTGRRCWGRSCSRREVFASTIDLRTSARISSCCSD